MVDFENSGVSCRSGACEEGNWSDDCHWIRSKLGVLIVRLGLSSAIVARCAGTDWSSQCRLLYKNWSDLIPLVNSDALLIEIRLLGNQISKFKKLIEPFAMQEFTNESISVHSCGNDEAELDIPMILLGWNGSISWVCVLWALTPMLRTSRIFEQMHHG